jgi:hypothetical protein
VKTGEIFTMALTNPKAKFKSIGQQFGDFAAHFNAVGKLVDKEGELVFPTYDMDWELVPQEVTWQEALQVWVGGKTITCDLSDATYRFTNGSDFRQFRDETENTLCKIQLINGKWFVE